MIVTTLLPQTILASGSGHWSSPYSVDQAIHDQDGTTHAVEGFVVGKPISSSSIITNNFPDDYAIAIADSVNETNTNEMVYVQIPSQYRSQYGLQSNPDLLGKKIKIEGCLVDYYAHPGVKCLSNIERVDSESKPDPDPDTGENYYSPAIGLSGEALKQSLHNIIDDHEELSYSEAWEALRNTDEDPANPNNVILLYTGRSQSENLNGGDVDDWNREHVWAKSHGDFGTSMGAGTDLHHLRPTDSTVNSSRGNKDFDNGGDPHHEAGGNYADSDSWEPRDEIKGDVARMLFYMAVRYEGDVSDEVDLQLNNQVNNGSNPFHGKLNALIEWHNEDPVSDFERHRNNLIYTHYQENRNPFIDHPEYVQHIW
ncbi:endonuclease [Halobacillus shinanisalinarum]|uniref:Endonuclease n=2 Tax=Halobacillus shinanisalinarum TaxID=2932258 RepID=A0ABY4H5Q7_9BACI|nr:endonuclease [Halobacillus shinanisalinarum]UOQ95694.1 endonuclease [Halobacillus shinanisalinarum]